ncbi:MAG: metalloprotease PmbA [Gammaproteobacteria bacterium]
MHAHAADTASITEQQLQELVRNVLTEARENGADQAEAGAATSSGLSTTVRLGSVETVEYQQDRGLGVTVFFDRRKGSASTSDLDPQAVRDTVAKACSIARYTAADPFSGLADARLMLTEVPDLDLCHPWGLTPEAAIDLAKECEAAALDYDPRIGNSEGATVSRHQSLRVYGNTHGFLGVQQTTSHSISCVVIGSADGRMERDYWYGAARDPGELESPREIGRKAASRTVDRLGARKISTRRTPVVFPAELARGLIGHLVSAISGPAQYRKASFLLDTAGEQIFPRNVCIFERPHIPRGLASAAFDSEGVATADRDLVTDGVLDGYVLDSYGARKLDLETTANAGGIHNLIVSPGSSDFELMLKNMDTGFLIRELIGQGVNVVTGDYSRGAAGFWVENGEIQYPVSEITIAGNLKEMFSGIGEVGTDIDLRGGIRTGSILIDSMTIAGD